VTVDWNRRQTDRWLHYVGKNCSSYELAVIPDYKQYPDCRGAGKIRCFAEKFATDKIIYIDTDTIINEDLFILFDMMSKNDHAIGFSYPDRKNRDFKQRKTPKSHQDALALNKKMSLDEVHWYPTGIIILNGFPPAQLYAGLTRLMASFEIHDYFKGDDHRDEYAFSYFIDCWFRDTKDELWFIPPRNSRHHPLQKEVVRQNRSPDDYSLSQRRYPETTRDGGVYT